MKKRKIVIIVGSVNDLKQCADGLELLRQQVAKGQVDVQKVCVRSTHRHLNRLLWLLDSFCVADGEDNVDVIIAGAGKAAHLPGCADAYLRNHLRDKHINVIGVAFQGADKKDNEAAILSITQVPGTQVRFAGAGNTGFTKACVMALGETVEITLPEVPPCQDFNLERAIELAEQG